MYLAPDTFVIPDDGRESYLLYAPLLGVAAHINGALARELEALKSARDGQAEPVDSEVREALVSLGVLSPRPYPDLKPESREPSFHPHAVSLFLTSACNLGCTYCYASANEAPKHMTWELAEKALAVVYDNAEKAGGRQVSIVLHGGGEATLQWELLRRIVEYTQAKRAATSISARLSIGTNGVMPESRARYLAEHFHSATVSLDGPPDVHDKNRPTIGGKPSYAIVSRTLRIFDELGLDYGLRMTVTRDWTERLPEAISEICARFLVRAIQAEPVFPVGRAERNDLASPDARAFVSAFRKAATIARNNGRRLIYSGARIGELRDTFCEASGRSFAVTPDGNVTSCYEVSDAADQRSETFFWGRFDGASGDFKLDETRRRRLQLLTVHGKSGCEECFCKWHCAGDCSAKLATLGDATNTAQNPRCEVNRALSKDQLVRAIHLGTRLTEPGRAEGEPGDCSNSGLMLPASNGA